MKKLLQNYGKSILNLPGFRIGLGLGLGLGRGLRPGLGRGLRPGLGRGLGRLPSFSTR